MSQINRKYNFQDETKTLANQIDVEFNQLIESFNAHDLLISNHINRIADPNSSDDTKDKHISNLDLKIINDKLGSMDNRYYTKPFIDELIGKLSTLNTNDKSNIVNAINEINTSINNAIYVLELNKWQVKNDGTDPINTTKGINDAMEWAVQNGYMEMLLPKGIYLIDENSTIEPQSYFTLNLNGSSLRINPNNLTNYSVISYQRNQIFSRITNGKIIGDRDLHDYSSGGTHEGGYGIQVGNFTPPTNGGCNSRYIILDNLDISDFTGDSITLNSTFGQISPFPTTLSSSWEYGDINPMTGEPIVSTNKIRSKLNFDMTQPDIVKNGYFGLYGNGYGSLGSDITCDYYNVMFYKSDNSFISSKTLVQFFDEVEVPQSSSYAKIVLHQSTIPASSNCLINVRSTTFPKNVFIQKCNLHHNRRQGVSICGAKNVFIEENEIHHIGGNTSYKGTDPQAGIDIEDGYDLNQFIHINRNLFHDNEKYNVIVVNGKCIYISNNTLLKINNDAYVSLSINAGVDKCIITGNTIRHSKVVLSGECQVINNHIYGTQITASPVYLNRCINISNCTIQNCKFVIDSMFPYSVNFDNCRFINDNDKLNSLSGVINWTIEYKNQPQKFSNCIFEGKDTSYFGYIPNNSTKQYWLFENCLFKGIPLPTLGRLVNCIGDGAILGSSYSSATGLTSDVLELYGCKFLSNDSNNIMLVINNLKSFRMENCYIEKTSGWVLKIQNVSKDVILKNNTIKITNDTLTRSIVTLDSSFSGNQIIFSSNFIYATNNPQIAIDNQTINKPEIIISDNVLKKTTLKINGTELLTNNVIDNIIDPYYKMSTEPGNLYFAKGQILYNTTPTSGGYIGWVCITGGVANKSNWLPSTNYPLNTLVNANSKVYKCIVAGKSGTIAPLHTSGTASDGTITWQFIDELAMFKQFGEII
ncbi:right-handed parallel beta-helix repeat-containing protein [Bacillus sp. AL-1R]